VQAGDREGDVEHTALTRLTLEPDAAPVQLDQRAGDVQAQARAGGPGDDGAAGPEETLEQLGVVLGRYSHSDVGHRDLEEAGFAGGSERDVDPATRGRVLHGVAQEVADDLHGPRLVTQRGR